MSLTIEEAQALTEASGIEPAVYDAEAPGTYVFWYIEDGVVVSEGSPRTDYEIYAKVVTVLPSSQTGEDTPYAEAVTWRVVEVKPA